MDANNGNGHTATLDPPKHDSVVDAPVSALPEKAKPIVNPTFGWQLVLTPNGMVLQKGKPYTVHLTNESQAYLLEKIDAIEKLTGKRPSEEDMIAALLDYSVRHYTVGHVDIEDASDSDSKNSEKDKPVHRIKPHLMSKRSTLKAPKAPKDENFFPVEKIAKHLGLKSPRHVSPYIAKIRHKGCEVECASAASSTGTSSLAKMVAGIDPTISSRLASNRRQFLGNIDPQSIIDEETKQACLRGL